MEAFIIYIDIIVMYIKPGNWHLVLSHKQHFNSKDISFVLNIEKTVLILLLSLAFIMVVGAQHCIAVVLRNFLGEIWRLCAGLQ